VNWALGESLVERYGREVLTSPPDTAQDLSPDLLWRRESVMDKYGIPGERAGEGSGR